MTELLFGINVSPAVAPGADPVADAQQAERLGFDFVSANDHMHGPDPRSEAWTMLSWIAAATTRIRVATRVLGVPFRHPSVVAKMAETFDRLSGGRLILGLGAGASDEEFRTLGLPVATARDKVDGLAEAIRIIRGLWFDPSFTFQGRHYRTDAAILEPKLEGRIPIWLGTYGPRALRVTGQLADGWIPSLELAPPEQVPAMRERIAAAAREAGRDPDGVVGVYNLEIRVDDRLVDEPFVLWGRPNRIAERLAGFVDLGFTAFNFIPFGPDTSDQAERLAREVVPAVRAAR